MIRSTQRFPTTQTDPSRAAEDDNGFQPHLFIVWQGGRPCGTRHSLREVGRVEFGRDTERSMSRSNSGASQRLRLGFNDRWMSNAHADLTRQGLHWVFADRGCKNGIFVDGNRVHKTALRDGNILQLGATLLIFRERVMVSPENCEDLDESGLSPHSGLRTLLPPLRREFDQLERVCKTKTPVLVLGPTGSGKELLAQAIHQRSGRHGKFIPVNCGALAPSLVESELFGHRKGAFSGAHQEHPGLVLASAGGTLFLDEVGDLSPPAQAALLRVLQEHEVRAVGAVHPTRLDLRILAATHRNLEQLVARGSFREDLYARLSGYVTELPALSKRTEDLGIIASAVLSPATPLPSFRPKAVHALLKYPWPRNGRELHNVLTRATILAGDAAIDIQHLRLASHGPTPAGPVGVLSSSDLDRRAELVARLEQHGGNISAVARDMGKVRSQVQRWIQRYQLKPEAFRSSRMPTL